MPVEVFADDALPDCRVPFVWPRDANKFCRKVCKAAAGVWVEPEAAFETDEAVEVEAVGVEDVTALPDKLCSRAWTILFRKFDCPADAELPMLELPSLSPSEAVPTTCWVELDELLVGCNQDQIFAPETLLIELMMNSFNEIGNDMGSQLDPFELDYR